MRDAILKTFPQAEEIQSESRVKRWRIPPGTLNKLVSFTANELADLETAIAILERENLVGPH